METLYERYSYPAFGYVRFFDKLTGRGLIRSTLDNQSYFIHYSAIEGRYPGNKRMNLEEGQPVNFTLLVYPGDIGVSWCKPLSKNINDFRIAARIKTKPIKRKRKGAGPMQVYLHKTTLEIFIGYQVIATILENKKGQRFILAEIGCASDFEIIGDFY